MPQPTHLVDVTDTFEAKLTAWREFKTAQDHLDELSTQMWRLQIRHGTRSPRAESSRSMYFLQSSWGH